MTNDWEPGKGSCRWSPSLLGRPSAHHRARAPEARKLAVTAAHADPQQDISEVEAPAGRPCASTAAVKRPGSSRRLEAREVPPRSSWIPSIKSAAAMAHDIGEGKRRRECREGAQPGPRIGLVAVQRTGRRCEAEGRNCLRCRAATAEKQGPLRKPLSSRPLLRLLMRKRVVRTHQRAANVNISPATDVRMRAVHVLGVARRSQRALGGQERALQVLLRGMPLHAWSPVAGGGQRVTVRDVRVRRREASARTRGGGRRRKELKAIRRRSPPCGGRWQPRLASSPGSALRV